MPVKLLWLVSQDDRLKRLRADGQSWDVIAEDLNISRNAAIERGRIIGARLPAPEAKAEEPDPERPPMAAGHEISWGLLTAGTCLAGEPYQRTAPDVRRPVALAA